MRLVLIPYGNNYDRFPGPPVMVEVCAERLFYKHGFALGAGKPFINLVVHLLQSGDADFSDKTLYLHDGFPFTYLRLFLPR